MSKFGRGVVGLCLLASGLTFGTAQATAVPAAGAGGRVALQSPVRYQDSRNAHGQTGVTTTTLGAGQILNVILVAHQTAGTASLHACGASASTGQLAFVFEPGEGTVHRVLTDATSDCLTATTAVDIIVDSYGNVSDAPTTDRLQYVPLTAPTSVLDTTVSALSTTVLNLGIATPAEARAAVIVLETKGGDPAGFATALTCGGGAPNTSDLQVTQSATANVAYVPVTATAGPCVFSAGSANLHVTLLGWLSTSGPDTTSLPPAVTIQLDDIRPPGLVAITPSRLLDTRSQPAPNGEKLAGGDFGELPFGADAARSISAVVMNVTVDQPEAGGFITVYPCDQPRPVTSNLNYNSGQTIANLVTAKLSATGSVCIFSSATTHVIIDLMGGYVVNGGSGSQAVAPLRLLDSRNAVGVPTRSKANADSTTTLHVAGTGGVPAIGAQAVTLNVTVDQPETGGFVTVYPCGEKVPNASNLNYASGQTIANLVTVKLGQDGNVCFYTSGSAHLIADLASWYQPSLPAGFKELAPVRVLDSRNAVGIAGKALLGAGSITTVALAGRGGLPATGAEAVTMNITVDQPQGGGFVTVFPCGQGTPQASNINYARGQTIANSVTVKLAANGTVCIYTSASAHLLADVAGYSTTTPDTDVDHPTHPLEPSDCSVRPEPTRRSSSPTPRPRLGGLRSGEDQDGDDAAAGAGLVGVVALVDVEREFPQAVALGPGSLGGPVTAAAVLGDDLALGMDLQVVIPGRVLGHATLGRDQDDVVAIEGVDQRRLAGSAGLGAGVLQ